MRVLKNFAMYFCSYPGRSSQRCLAAYSDSGHWFKISPQFFLNPKPTLPRGSAKRASILRENGLLSLKKLSYFPLLVYTFHCFFEVHYGLKWVHDLAGLPDPYNSSLVLPLKESSRRLLSIPVKKKEPETPEAI